MSKAQLVSKKIAASKGLDLNGFKNAFQIYARETAGGNGSSAVGAAMSVTLGTAKVDLYELFQVMMMVMTMEVVDLVVGRVVGRKGRGLGPTCHKDVERVMHALQWPK